MSRNVCAFTAYQANLPDLLSLNEETDGRIVLTTRHGGVVNVLEIPFDRVEEMHRRMGEYLATKQAAVTPTEVSHVQV